MAEEDDRDGDDEFGCSESRLEFSRFVSSWSVPEETAAGKLVPYGRGPRYGKEIENLAQSHRVR